MAIFFAKCMSTWQIADTGKTGTTSQGPHENNSSTISSHSKISHSRPTS